MSENNQNVKYIRSNIYEFLRNVQAEIYSEFSNDDFMAIINHKKTISNPNPTISKAGEDILKEVKAINKISNSIHRLCAENSCHNIIDLRTRSEEFINNRFPNDYKPFIKLLKSCDKISDFYELANKFDDRYKNFYIQFLYDYGMEIKTIINTLGQNFDKLNQILEKHGYDVRFDTEKIVVDTLDGPKTIYKAEKIVPLAADFFMDAFEQSLEILRDEKKSNVFGVDNYYETIENDSLRIVIDKCFELEENIRKNRGLFETFDTLGDEMHREEFKNAYEDALSERRKYIQSIAKDNKMVMEYLTQTLVEISDMSSRQIASDKFDLDIEEVGNERAKFTNSKVNNAPSEVKEAVNKILKSFKRNSPVLE